MDSGLKKTMLHLYKWLPSRVSVDRGLEIATLTMHHGTVLGKGAFCLRPLKQSHGALSTSLLPGL